MKVFSGSPFPLSLLLGVGIVSVVASSAFGQQEKAPQACAPTRIEGSAGFAAVFSSDPRSAPLEALVRLGYRQFYKDHKDAAASVTLNEARTLAVTTKDTCAEALSVFALGAVAENSSFKDAPGLFQAALELFTRIDSTEGIARVHFKLGSVYMTQSRTADSTEQFRLAVQGFEKAGDVSSKLFAQAILARRTDRGFAPLAAEAQSRHLPCVEGQIQQIWADDYYSANDYKQAMEHDVLADALLTSCPTGTAMRVAVQTSMGRLERLQGRPEVALQHYKIALQLQQETGDLSYVPQTYNAIAIAYDHLNDLPNAVRANRKGFAVAQQIHSQPFMDFLNANLGSTYAQHGKFVESIPLLEGATQNVTSEQLLCVRLTQLGDAYAESGQVERGIETLTRGLALCRAKHEEEQTENNLRDLAEAQLKLGHFDDALHNARDGLALAEERRSHLVPADAYKQGFISENRELYNSAIAALMALHRPAEALETAEQARSRAFLDLLGSHSIDKGLELSVNVKDHSFEKYRKDLIESSHSVAPLTTDAMLQTAVRLNSTLLVYWYTPGTLYTWVAHPGQPILGQVQKISADKLERLVAATRLSSQAQTRGISSWSRLYRLLIAPIATSLPREDGGLITIVPSGPLFALSFAALLAPDGHYLAEHYRTHTIPSVSLLSFTQKNATSASTQAPRFLFLNSPQLLPRNNGIRLPKLPGTSVEVNAITPLLPASQVTRLSGPLANLEGLRAASSSATTLHFATHAVLNDADPYASFLALDDTHHTGKLSVADIYALDLHSNLVVLSACSTGLGKVTGDGVAGMSRAFFYAGTASVLTTLWDIADEPTAKFLPRFYAGIASGQPPSAALRAAQISMLHDLRLGKIKAATLSGIRVLPPDPAYWASFSLAGEP